MFKFSCMGLWPDGSSAYFQALFIWPASIHCSQPYKEKKNRYSSKPQDQFSNLFPLRTFPLSTAYKASLGNSWVMHQCHFVHTNTSSLYWRRHFFTIFCIFVSTNNRMMYFTCRSKQHVCSILIVFVVQCYNIYLLVSSEHSTTS